MYIYIHISLSLYDYGDGDDDNLYEAVIQWPKRGSITTVLGVTQES